MKSRLAILMMLVLGMLLSTTGAGLALTGLSGNGSASVAQYPDVKTPPTGTSPGPTGGGRVLGDQDTGSDVLGAEEGGSPSSGASPGSAVQPSRQVEAGAGNELPFTGFAAIPILLGGLALLSVGLVLRRRTSDQRD